MIEEWRDIPGFDGDYKVSNTGKVMSYKRATPAERVIQIYKVREKPHKSVMLSYKGATKQYEVHRLMWQAFYGFPVEESRCSVLFKDNNTLNCTLDNLFMEICEVDETYTPDSKRQGIKKSETVRARMAESKKHQSPETLAKAAKTRSETCRKRREEKIRLQAEQEQIEEQKEEQVEKTEQQRPELAKKEKKVRDCGLDGLRAILLKKARDGR